MISENSKYHNNTGYRIQRSYIKNKENSIFYLLESKKEF